MVPQSCVGEIVIAWSVSVVPESGVGKNSDWNVNVVPWI